MLTSAGHAFREAGISRRARPDAEPPKISRTLDTLAQLGQNGAQPSIEGVADKLRKRARKKYFTVPLATSLAELRSPMEQSYRNTIYCAASLSQQDGKITGGYCGNRWCMVCNGIRTAKAFHRYEPILRTWERKHFLTLTRQNVTAERLADTIKEMIERTQVIKKMMRRTDKIKFVALRKLECTYNRHTDEYHPHFHFVVRDALSAKIFLQHWLDLYGEELADPKAQDVKACDDHSLHEMFKYFTKLVTKEKRRGADTGQLDIQSAWMPPAALDIIFRAIRGRRTFQPVGFVVAGAKEDETDALDDLAGTPAITRPGESIGWEWSQTLTDWVDRQSGECLTGYDPSAKFQAFVEAVPSSDGVRRLDEHTRADVERWSRETTARIRALPSDRHDPLTLDETSEIIASLWRISWKRARALAPVLVAIPDTQFALFAVDAYDAPQRSVMVP